MATSATIIGGSAAVAGSPQSFGNIVLYADVVPWLRARRRRAPPWRAADDPDHLAKDF